MHEAFWNGLFDVRWEETPLGPEAIRLVLRLRERGYAERTCRDYGHAVVQRFTAAQQVDRQRVAQDMSTAAVGHDARLVQLASQPGVDLAP